MALNFTGPALSIILMVSYPQLKTGNASKLLLHDMLIIFGTTF
jgi:hypothetical protein